MKQFVILSMMLASLFVLASCSDNNGQNPSDIPVYHYMLGYDTANGQMYVYKDDAILFTYGGNGKVCLATCLDYEKNGSATDIFSCGSVTEGGVEKPVIWKNDVASFPLGNVQGRFESLFRKNGSLYVAGTILPEGKSVKCGVLLKDDKVIYQAKDSTSFDCLDFGQSGDFYVAGTGFFNKMKFAHVWRLSNSTSPVLVDKGDSVSLGRMDSQDMMVTSMYVGMRDISVAVNSLKSDGSYRAWWWCPKDLSTLYCLYDGMSEACTTVISAGSCWIGGKRQTTDGMKAVIWQNWNRTIDMSYDTNPGGSCTDAIYYDGYNNYELVSSPQQIQYCRNGALQIKMSVSATFKPADLVIVKK